MQIKSSALASQLSKGLSSAYLLYGDEPLLIEDSHQYCLNAAKKNDFIEKIVLHVDTSFDWSLLTEHLDSFSLFSNKKIIELRLPSGKPGAKGSNLLAKYFENSLPEDIILIILCGKVEASVRRSKWVKAIDKIGVVIDHPQVKPFQLESWVKQRAQSYNLKIDDNAYQLICYYLEGNLLSIDQTLRQLNLLFDPSQTIQQNDVSDIISDSSRYSTFALADECLKGNLKNSLHILHSLIREKAEPVLINWALQKEVKQLIAIAINYKQNIPIKQSCDELRIWQSKQNLIQGALQRLPLSRLYLIHQNIATIDKIIKGIDNNYQSSQSRDNQLWHNFEKVITLFSGQR